MPRRTPAPRNRPWRPALLIVWSSIAEKFRKAVFGGKLLACTGSLQREGQMIHVISKTLHDWSSQVRKLHEGVENLRFYPGEEAPNNNAGNHQRGPRDATMMKLKRRDFR